MKTEWLERWLGVAAVALIVTGIVVFALAAVGAGGGPVQAYPFTGMMALPGSAPPQGGYPDAAPPNGDTGYSGGMMGGGGGSGGGAGMGGMMGGSGA
ncbi:MAG: hypothetical protein AAB270_06545, partial [Chloroflexota bacterium]